jgi:ABC-type cobalamin/Fe3+-siderophores transport system ATPase subunit
MAEVKIRNNTNYIFTFGSVGSGKSTLMATLTRFLSEKATLHINPKNINGTRLYLKDWLKKLEKQEFPPRSLTGEIVEVDLGIQFRNTNEEDSLIITFLEMSGEDLQKVDIKTGDGMLTANFVTYIKNAKMFLIVTDFDSAKDDDQLIFLFLNKLLNEYKINIYAVALIISKWDLSEGKINVRDFVAENMKLTKNWLESSNIEEPRVFTFSVGKVQSNLPDSESKIVQLLLDDSKKIITWIEEKLNN